MVHGGFTSLKRCLMAGLVCFPGWFRVASSWCLQMIPLDPGNSKRFQDNPRCHYRNSVEHLWICHRMENGLRAVYSLFSTRQMCLCFLAMGQNPLILLLDIQSCFSLLDPCRQTTSHAFYGNLVIQKKS